MDFITRQTWACHMGLIIQKLPKLVQHHEQMLLIIQNLHFCIRKFPHFIKLGMLEIIKNEKLLDDHISYLIDR